MTPPAPSPIVSGDLITVLAGEKVFVEGDLKDGRLTNLVAVQQASHPDRTLVFELKQEPSIGDGTGMILKVESPFPGALKYRLGMMLVSDERLRKTSSCPLFQGKPVYEHWSHPLFQVVAAGFRVVEESSEDATRCE